MEKPTRTLSDEEKEKLAKDVNLVSEFKQNKFEKEAQKNWDIFYKRNTTKFFKDRHWTRREFGELVNSSDEESLVLFEVGCGVGNFMFPLMVEDKNLYVYACDFSHRAVQFVKENPSYDPSHCTVFQCDIVNDDLTSQVPDGVVDVATMIFVLSAIHPDKMAIALKKILQTLKPGGSLLVRDYGLYDYAMLRFAPGHKLSENFYVRQDGTRAYYFSLEVLDTLMRSCGFEVSRSEYIHRQTVNKKEGLEVPRIFVQGKYVKPTGKISPLTENVIAQSLHTNEKDDKMEQTIGTVQSSISTGSKAKTKENAVLNGTIDGSSEIEVTKDGTAKVAVDETATDKCIDCDRLRELEESCKNTDSEKSLNGELTHNLYAEGETIYEFSRLSIEKSCDLTQENLVKDCDTLEDDT